MTAVRGNPEAKPTARSTKRGRGAGSSLAAWRDLHLYSLLSSIGRLLARPWASALTVGVMAVALALPLCLALVLGSVERISGGFREAREISLFLKPGLNSEAMEAARATLSARPDIASVQMKSAEEGLQEFREMADFAGALRLLDYNPLPAVLIVIPRSGVDETMLADTLRDLPDADFVQHDAQWRSRLTAWLDFGRRLTAVIAALLGLGVLLVVGNTVRLDIQGRSEEIQTLQLLGATDGFVRRPFLYLGAWYGGLSALLALAVALAARSAMQLPVTRLVESYGASFELRGLSPSEALYVVMLGIGMGWIGAWIAAGHHLRQNLPGQ